MDLSGIETYYDTVPRAVATTEEVGPFTLFVAEPGSGMAFYARPRLGPAHDRPAHDRPAEPTADDVRRVLARQRELGVPQAIEWVHDLTPVLLPAARAALAGEGSIHECPLLALSAQSAPGAVDAAGRFEVLAPDSPDLARAVGAVHAAFAGRDEIAPVDVTRRAALIASGHLVVVAAYDDSGALVGAGSTAPRGPVSELMGIGVLPGARRRGFGGAITRSLVEAARAHGVRTAFLSAGSDAAAGVYRAVGFDTVGTACILERPGS